MELNTYEKQLTQLIQTSLDLANGRLDVGSNTAAVVALRRMQGLRVELGRLAAMQCRFMELYTDVLLHWEAVQRQQRQQRSQGFSNECSIPDVSHYWRRMSLIQEQATALSVIRRTDQELLEEMEQTRAHQQQAVTTAPARL